MGVISVLVATLGTLAASYFAVMGGSVNDPNVAVVSSTTDVGFTLIVTDTQTMTKAQLTAEIRSSARRVLLQQGVPIADANVNEAATAAADAVFGRPGTSAAVCSDSGKVCLRVFFKPAPAH